MSLDLSTPTPIVIPARKRRSRAIWLIPAAVATVVAFWALGLGGFRPSQLWSRTPPPIATLEVDQGDIALVVTENGALESSNNATARCHVEALIGLVGGAQGMNGPNAKNGTQGSQGTQGGMGGQGGQSGQAGQSGQQGQQAAQAQAQAQEQAKAKAKAKTAAKGKTGMAKAKGTASTGTAKAGSTSTGASGSAQAGAGASGAAGGQGGSGQGGTTGTDTGTTVKKPEIRSFSYQVEPHQPLRPQTKSVTPTKTQQAVDPASQGGGGRSSRGGSSSQTQEKAGSTRIISILPEGTWVKAGDVVCELDSAAFRDEVRAQQIRYAQAKAWVEQAKSLLEVAEIALREYRDGIYPQDVQLIRQYLQTTRTEEERAQRTYTWSKETTAKGFRASAQLKADELALQQAKIALGEAEGMEERLEKYTAPRLIKNLAAKVAAIRADKLAQEQAFELESDRLKKLEKMVEYCTMRAPGDGIVVYANQADRFGQAQNTITEGATVRQGQPIFYLPDPNQMQVKAKVNESKVALIQSGQPARIVIDAFPERPLHGTVTEVNPISAPANGPTSDVRIYYAVIKLDTRGFSELRPGLSAEVSFLVDLKRQVTRVPLQAVRWVNSTSYVAVAMKRPETGPKSEKQGPAWQWRRVTLGLSNENYIEVVSGVKPGEKVIAHPEVLPPPRDVESRRDVAVTSQRPRG